MIAKSKKLNEGFTLVELLIAVSLFIVIVTVSMGSILSIFDAYRKAQYSKTVVDNLNYALESMTRNVRFGTNYYCGISSDVIEPVETLNCASGNSSLSVTFKGERIIYRLNGTAIQRSDDGGVNFINITSSDTVIQYLKFYVFGSDSSDSKQPYVIAVIKGYAGTENQHCNLRL